MSGEWTAAAVTVLIGIAGFVSTYLANRAGQRHAEHLAARADARAERDHRVTLYTEAVNTGRRVQRASWNWTTSPTQETSRVFAQALEDFSSTVAELRLVGGKDVADRAIRLERTFRKHSQRTAPRIDHDNPDFQLTPLIDTMRAELNQSTWVGESRT